MSSKTLPRVLILDPMWLLRAPKCVQMSSWERSREVEAKARAGRVQGRNHFVVYLKKIPQNKIVFLFVFHVFAMFPRRLKEACRMSPDPKNKMISALNYTCCCLYFYFSLQRQRKTLPADCMSSLCGDAAMTRRRRLQYIYIYILTCQLISPYCLNHCMQSLRVHILEKCG